MSYAGLIGILVAAGIVAAVFLLLRKPSGRAYPVARGGTGGNTPEARVRIVTPASGACCDAAHKIETHLFHRQHAPPLPLADCSMQNRCHCRYQPARERRLAERRQNEEKREAIRYEQNPRRAGRGRRAQDGLFDQD